MSDKSGRGRRTFLKEVAAAGLALRGVPSPAFAQVPSATAAAVAQEERIRYPRTYTGRQLAMIAFPLGGIGTGSISLGGRGQLRDWEIYNRPDKGRTPKYVLPGHLGQARRLEAGRPRSRSAAHAAVRRVIRTRIRQRSRIEQAGRRQLHRRVPAGSHRVRGFAAAGSRHARRLQPFHPPRCRRIRVSGRDPAIPRAQSRPRRGHRFHRPLD